MCIWHSLYTFTHIVDREWQLYVTLLGGSFEFVLKCINKYTDGFYTVTFNLLRLHINCTHIQQIT